MAFYDELIGLDLDDVAIDGSTQLAPGGGPDTNNARTIEHRLAALQLGFTILMIYRLIDHLTDNDLSLETIR